MTYREIHAPNEIFSGTAATVHFRDGVGRVDEERQDLIAWFERHGYALGELTDEEPFKRWEPHPDDIRSSPRGVGPQDGLDPEDVARPRRQWGFNSAHINNQ